MEGIFRARLRITGPVTIAGVSPHLGEDDLEETWRGRTSRPSVGRIRTGDVSLELQTGTELRRKVFAIRPAPSNLNAVILQQAGGGDLTHNWEGGTPIDVVDLDGIDPPHAASIAASIQVRGLYVATGRQSALPAVVTGTNGGASTAFANCYADWLIYDGELFADRDVWNPSE